MVCKIKNPPIISAGHYTGNDYFLQPHAEGLLPPHDASFFPPHAEGLLPPHDDDLLPHSAKSLSAMIITS